MSYIVIGLGGAAGAIARVAIGRILPAEILGIPFPILFVNILGCFIIDVLTELLALDLSSPNHIKYFLVSGFLGGFTTFSSFALEFELLSERNEYISSIAYVALSFGLSIAFFFAGLKIIRMFL